MSKDTLSHIYIPAGDHFTHFLKYCTLKHLTGCNLILNFLAAHQSKTTDHLCIQYIATCFGIYPAWSKNLLSAFHYNEPLFLPNLPNSNKHSPITLSGQLQSNVLFWKRNGLSKMAEQLTYARYMCSFVQFFYYITHASVKQAILA